MELKSDSSDESMDGFEEVSSAPVLQRSHSTFIQKPLPLQSHNIHVARPAATHRAALNVPAVCEEHKPIVEERKAFSDAIGIEDGIHFEQLKKVRISDENSALSKLAQKALRNSQPLQSILKKDPEVRPLFRPPTNNRVITVANAFGQPPFFPGDLTITGSVFSSGILASDVKCDTISSLTHGGEIVNISTGEPVFNGVNITGVSDLTCDGIIFTDSNSNTPLSRINTTTGSYTLATGGGNSFTGGTGNFTFQMFDQTAVLSLSQFSGTTEVLTGPPDFQNITFSSPAIDLFIPPVGTTWPYVLQTTADGADIGTVTVSRLSPAQLTFNDSFSVGNWAWTSSTAGQGWSASSITWT